MQALDIGFLIENLLPIWPATDPQDWVNHLGFIAV
jgi:hypothetical protein